MKHTWRDRDGRLPTDTKPDGQALPWALQSGSRKKVSRVSREEVLLGCSWIWRLTPRTIEDELSAQKSISLRMSDK